MQEPFSIFEVPLSMHSLPTYLALPESPPHCVLNWDFTRTLPGNRNATVKKQARVRYFWGIFREFFRNFWGIFSGIL